MKQTHFKSSPSFSDTPLKFIRGAKHSTHTQWELIKTAWQFAYSVLWNNQLFSEFEKQVARDLIQDFIGCSKNQRRMFLQFCQRVIIARQHFGELDSSICLPSLFLDKENPDGFYKTSVWYEPIKELRRSLPNYKIEIKALAEAALEFSEEPTLRNFRYWRSYFTDRQEGVLLDLLTIFCCNNAFKIE